MGATGSCAQTTSSEYQAGTQGHLVDWPYGPASMMFTVGRPGQGDQELTCILRFTERTETARSNGYAVKRAIERHAAMSDARTLQMTERKESKRREGRFTL